MYVDSQNEFADSQAVTVDAISTNVIDLEATNTLKNIGAGEPVYLVVQTDTTFTSSGTPTLTVTLESDSTANLATSATVHYTSSAIALSSLVAGTTHFVVALPRGQYERYLGVRWDVGAGGPMTAGAISAFLTLEPDAWQPYADAL